MMMRWLTACLQVGQAAAAITTRKRSEVRKKRRNETERGKKEWEKDRRTGGGKMEAGEKKMKLFCLVALFIVGFTQAEAQQKMGYLDSIVLLGSMPQAKTADEQLKALQTKLGTDGDVMLKAIEAKIADVTKRQEQGTITGKELQEVQAQIEQDRQKILKFEQDAQKQLLDKREELYGPIFEKANTAIKDVAKANGYSMVFDSSTGVLLHADETNDLMSLVKAKLGI
ncbi:MAG: OmpH family outer membrane protein [Bacteroidota bacterium]